MEKIDLYEILGVSRDASDKQIKKAYYVLAIEYHPDKHINAKEEEQKRVHDLFVALERAYRILHDAQMRATYDETGTVDESYITKNQEVFEFVSRLFMEVIASPQFSIERSSLFAIMGEAAQSTLQANQKSKRTIKKEMQDVEKMKARIKGKDTFFVDILVELNRKAVMALTQIDEVIEMQEKAIEFIADYGYESDMGIKVPNRMQLGGMSFTMNFEDTSRGNM